MKIINDNFAKNIIEVKLAPHGFTTVCSCQDDSTVELEWVKVAFTADAWHAIRGFFWRMAVDGSNNRFIEENAEESKVKKPVLKTKEAPAWKTCKVCKKPYIAVKNDNYHGMCSECGQAEEVENQTKKHKAALIRLGSVIKDSRLAQGMTQVTLGNMVGISNQSVSQIERGYDTVSIESVRKVCQALGVEFTLLILDA